jgi:GNAT superfamily N-acetyltransferase
MDRSAILKAFEANLWDRASYLAGAREDGEVQNSTDLLVVDSGLPCRSVNTIGKSSLHPRFGMDRVESAIKHFQDKSSPFSWVLGPLSGHGSMEPALKGFGLTCPEEEWIMAMALDEIRSIPGNLPNELSIKEVSTTEALEDYANVLAVATNPPDENLKTFYMDTKEAAIAPASPLKLYVGYVSEKPVAVQEAFSAHGIINFYAMAAVSSTQGKGYGAALMIAALREAKKASLRLAGVQTAEASRALYERLGFKPVGRIAAYR